MTKYPIEIPIQNLKRFLETDSISDRDIQWIEIGLKQLPFFAVPIFRRQIGHIFRVTVNNRIPDVGQERIEDLKYLRNPDKSIVKKMGRANLINQSVLYGGFEPMTILNELKPNVGDLITVTEWELTTDFYLTVAPIFKKIEKPINNGMSLDFHFEYIHAIRRLDNSEVEQREMLLSFLTDCYAKQVGKEHTDYFLSAYFSNHIFNVFENGTIDTIVYPSVQVDGSFMNIAMDSDVFRAHYKVKTIYESKITKAEHQKRQYLMVGKGITSKVDGDKIIWE
jgi:hypothetical protein